MKVHSAILLELCFFYFVLNVIEFQNPDSLAVSDIMHPLLSFWYKYLCFGTGCFCCQLFALIYFSIHK